MKMTEIYSEKNAHLPENEAKTIRSAWYAFLIAFFFITSSFGNTTLWSAETANNSPAALAPCTTPTAQPTALSLSRNATTVSGFFTSASPAADNYLVLRSTSATAPSPGPVNGTTYVAGNVISGATVVDVDNNTSFNATGLTANTTYYFYIYSYNSTPCTGGPLYLGTSPLTASITTLAGAGYCTTSGGNSVCIGKAYISGLNNPGTQNSTGAGYQDWTTRPNITVQAQGGPVTVSANTLADNNGYWKVLVDWNNDGDFGDTGETMYTYTTTTSSSIEYGFLIGASQAPGIYRVRIALSTSTFLLNPCGSLGTGEAEDYLLKVIPSCTSTIATVTNGTTCGPGTATLTATATTGGDQFRWYDSEFGGVLLATTATGSWVTPSVSATTSYWVTTFSGTCEATTRAEVKAIVKAITTLSISNATPTVCGEDSIIDLSTTAGTEVIYLLTENFEGGTLGAFSNINNDSNAANATKTERQWTNRSSIYSPSNQLVWFPKVSSGYGTNKFASAKGYTNSAKPTTFVENSLTSNTINGTGISNLKLGLRMYYSRYSGDDRYITPTPETSTYPEYVKVEASSDNGGGWTTLQTFTADYGTGTSFGALLYSLPATFNNKPQIKIRIKFRQYNSFGIYLDGGVAVDDIELYGERPLTNPTFVLSGIPAPTAFTTAACTPGSEYAGGPVPQIWVKPTLQQLELSTYTFTATATLSNGCPISSNVNVTNQSKVWKGSSSNDWNNGANWAPSGVPTATTCVIIPTGSTSQIMNAPDALAKNLVVKAPTGNLELQSGRNLTVTDFIKVETGATFNVRNSANLVQVTSPSTNTGVITMERNANICQTDYVYWSSPVANFASSAISPGTPSQYIYKWAPTTVTGYTSNFGNWQSGNETMVNGKGYIVRGPSSYTTTPQNYTATFNGVPNNATITTPISRGTYTGLDYTGPTTTPVTKDDDNWNLVGNPYPSSISADAFLAANAAKIAPFVEVWTHGTTPSGAIADPFYQDYVNNYTVADYIRYNELGGTQFGYDGRIGAGQGFMVLMDEVATPNTVVFNNSMRSAGYRNDQFFRTGEENGVIERNRIWLNLIKPDGSSSNTLVGYATGAKKTFDNRLDAIANGPKTNFELYSLAGNKALSIQGRPLPFDNNDVISMGVSIPQDGNYTIGITGVDGLFANESQNIYLEDKTLGIIHDLRTAPYSFTAQTGRFENRFDLRYTNNALSNNDITALENSVVVYSNGKLNVKSNNEPIKEIVVYDLLGRVLVNSDNVNTNEFTINKLNPTQTTLIVKVTLENNVVVSKKVIY